MAAVQVVPTHVVGARDGQASASNQLHYPSQVRFPVSKELVGQQNTKAQSNITAQSNGFKQQVGLSVPLPFCFDPQDQSADK